MSFASEEEVDCPCGETFPARLWNSINLREDPDLRSVLMGGELNVAACPACKALVFTERFLIVHDPEAELMAFVHPKAREAEREYLEACMHRDVAQAEGVEGGAKLSYPPALYFGLDALVDAMAAEQESNDQSAIVDALGAALPANVVRLPPAKARAAGLPRSVPLAGGGGMAERLAAGLEALLAVNDRLTVYAALRVRLASGGLPASALAAL